MFLFLAKTVVLLPWHTLMFFPMCCECSWTTNSSLLNKQLPRIKFFPYQSIFFDFSTALHLYLLIKYWQANSSKCSNIICLWAFRTAPPEPQPVCLKEPQQQPRFQRQPVRRQVGFQEMRVAPSKEILPLLGYSVCIRLNSTQKFSCKLHPFHTPSWDLDNFKF